jgi:hypothetical protein
MAISLKIALQDDLAVRIAAIKRIRLLQQGSNPVAPRSMRCAALSIREIVRDRGMSTDPDV